MSRQQAPSTPLDPADLDPRPSSRPPGAPLLPAFLRRVFWSLVPAAIIVGAVSGVVFGDEGLLARHALKQRLFRMDERVEQIKAENEVLREQIQSLRTDPVAVRRASAEQLLAAPTGSTIYRFQTDMAPSH